MSGFLKNLFSNLIKDDSNQYINNEIRVAPKEIPIATIIVKNYGTIKAELYPHIAPNTVNNFINLSNNGFYNNLTFHRVIKDFVLQYGCPKGNGTGGPGYCIRGEFEKNKFKNDLKHTDGILSMARSLKPNSAGSQIFIVTKPAPHLDKNYAAFGKVIKGMDIVRNIENVATKHNDMPIDKIIIESIIVDTKGVDYPNPNKM
ncbi:peptidylprolyl isomerase [Romboutsia maritimum]|uniref:Peptidyl-prolyl cis-trans isomerase n=1 Tax=Romboutsia maritimum TaxID=2020948 RepID=A0A371IV08_9FIRM|nr:peptidylprolyl isomerase [Romboutsia maritimum]RDY24305.1 peptidylprolyl isomerase [Romboutsia maritimum]